MSNQKDTFKQFIKVMNEVLADNISSDGRNQQDLLEDLFKLEDKFRDILISTNEGKKVYKEFVNYITEEKGNILSARVYFRERQETFSNKISRCFKEVKPHLLYKFHINYNFAKWVCDNYRGPKRKSLSHNYKKIVELRKTLCENNLPLAINRAKLFWSKTPNSHLDYMDFIQDANEGLINAIDKFVPPYKTVFRSVAIGRMTLNMLTDHNATLMKFSPTEKRVLYRANNAKVKEKLTNQDEVLDYVKQSFKNVTAIDLRAILSAASGLSSIDKKIGDSEFTLQDVVPNEEDTAEEQMIRIETMNRAAIAVENLPIIEMKVIKMQFGVEKND